MVESTAMTLEQLQEMRAGSALSTPASSVYQARLQAIREAGIGAGIRASMKQQFADMQQAIASVETELDQIYNFAPLMVQKRIVPPVLTAASQVYTQEGTQAIRIAGGLYRLEQQARFASTPPHWRGYLTFPDPAQIKHNALLLPSGDHEQSIWRQAVQDGWQQGQEQAIRIFRQQFDRLQRDYLGMIRFHQFALQRKVTLPVVTRQHRPINAQGQELAIQDVLLRLVVLPSFNTESEAWHKPPTAEEAP